MIRLFAAILPLTSLCALTSWSAVTSEFVYEQAPFPSCHASTIVETPQGDLLAAWFEGTAEGKPDVAIWMSRKQGGTWSTPAEMAREQGVATYNPVLFYTADQRLWLYYKFGPSPQTWSGARRFSSDDGRTWSPVEHLPAGLLGPIKDKPLLLNDGTIVSGTSVESYHSWACWVERSRDNGKSWTKHGPIIPESLSQSETGTYGIIQPAIVPLPDGRLRMFVRATKQIGHICYADSRDNGQTWTAAKPTTLPNPNSGIDAVALRDGRIVIVYNHTTQGRSPLNLAVSADGEHWQPFLALEEQPGEFSYPAIIQGHNGDLHITYTYNRRRIKHVQVPLADVPKETR